MRHHDNRFQNPDRDREESYRGGDDTYRGRKPQIGRDAQTARATDATPHGEQGSGGYDARRGRTTFGNQYGGNTAAGQYSDRGYRGDAGYGQLPSSTDPQAWNARADAHAWDAHGAPAHDPAPRGPHAGKGPKGYQRSDQRLLEDVSAALTHDDEVDASEIQVQVKDGEVTLTGTVADRQQKRLAERCAERVEGVRDVQNQIRMR